MRVLEIPMYSGLEDVIKNARLNPEDPSLYILLPDIPAVSQAERFLLGYGLWGERVLTFGKLSEVSNLRVGVRPIELSRTGRLFLIEEVINDLRDGLSYFKEIVSIRGFSESVLRLIAELKHARIDPGDLLEVSEKVGEEDLREKLRDLALIFDLYQYRLREEGLVDDIDKLRLLSEWLRGDKLKLILPEARILLVFGFFDFTPSQLEVLRSMEDAGVDLLVSLPPLSPRLKSEVTDRIKGWFSDFRTEYIPQDHRSRREVEVHSFPSFREECEFVAREIKKAILEGSLRPDEIAVVMRSYPGKENNVIRAFERLGIPYSMPGGSDLGKSPLGRFIIDLLGVKSSGLERRLFINLLRSPFLSVYLGGTGDYYELIADLDLESRNSRVLGGVREWRAVLGGFKDKWFSERVMGIIDEMEKRFNSNSLDGFIEDLGGILDHLLVYRAVEGLSLRSCSHKRAWKRFRVFLSEILFLSRIRFKKRLEGIDGFISLLKDLMSEERFSPSDPSSGEGVHVIKAFEARGTSFPMVFILDMGERGFPLPAPRDPILKNREREEINTLLGGGSLRIEDNHYESEEALFSLISNSTRKRLYITYSYLDDKERSSLPSYLVDKLIREEGIGVKRHSLEETYSETEWIYSRDDLARYLFYKGAYREGPYSDYLSENWGPFKRVLTGLHAEGLRLVPRGVYSRFEGIIDRRDLLPPLSRLSPTGLETYGDCPFKYFASRILGLKEMEEVEDEATALDLGSFYHKVLRGLFESIGGEMGGRVDLRGITDVELIDRLKRVLRVYDFNREFHWLSSGIRDLVRIRALDEILPRFVLSEAKRIRNWNERGFFPAYFEEKLELDVGGIGISGRADRIDIGREGALVIDYKLRSSSSRGFFSHKNLQLPLYLSALEKRGINPYGGYYRFVEKPEEEKGVDMETEEDLRDLIRSARDLVEMYVNLMNNGFFAPLIVEKKPGFEKTEIELRKDLYSSCRWCEFSDLCRVEGGVKRRVS
jgi:ATP-dependent helicase/DNAse subunit B